MWCLSSCKLHFMIHFVVILTGQLMKAVVCDSNIAEKTLIVAVCGYKQIQAIITTCFFTKGAWYSLSTVWLLSVISVIASCHKSTSPDPCILKPFLSDVSRVFRCKDVLCVNGPQAGVKQALHSSLVLTTWSSTQNHILSYYIVDEKQNV